MTARTQRQDSFEIDSLPGESPTEVVNDFIRELQALGHEIKVTGHHIDCYACIKQARVYYPISTSQVVIYSDISDGEQCAARQESVFTGGI